MKKILILSALAFAAMCGNAQTLKVTTGNVNYHFNAAEAGVMNFDNSTDLTISGKEFSTSTINVMKVVSESLDANMVLVKYSGSDAIVDIAGNVAKYIEVSISGADVVIDQSAEVGDNTCGEITYRLLGNSTNGSFTLNGEYKASIELAGLTLTSTSGAPIVIENGKRIAMRVTEGTVNTLVDSSTGSQKGCISCKGHLEFKQKGTLNVTGNKSHAIYSKEYIQLKNTKINVLSAVKDGVNCNQYFLMESGELNISGTGDDGVQVAYKDATDRETEDTGSISITGGTVNMTITADACKGFKCEGDFYIKKGTVTITTSGGGLWDADKVKTKAASCIGADGSVTIDGGTLTLKSTGGGGKGISCDGDFTVNDGEINIATTGGMCAYSGGKMNQNYTGNADNINSDYKSSPKGIKCDSNVSINGGAFYVTTAGNGGEGIESKKQLTIAGGTIVIRAYDDGINSTGNMYIKGGDIEVIAKNNDGIDSNGNIYISGGVIRSFGAKSPECGFDVNSPYTIEFTGGVILGVGGANSAPSKSTSTQAYVLPSITVTAGSTLTIGTSTETLYSFEIPTDYTTTSSGGRPGGGWGGSSSNGVIISLPQLVSGTSYTVKCGSNSASATARLTGGGSSF